LRIFNRLVMSLAIAFGALNTGLAFLGQKDISVYFILDGLAFLVITLLYTYLNPRARGGLNAVSSVVFAGFLVVVVIKVIEILK
jgi:1,4-dihydroxy-2-naphthoate octaprenyltransferase